MTDWMLIFGYVCFALGAILIVAGFVRLVWWATRANTNKKRARRAQEANQNFYTYFRDPWLRAPSMASLASQRAIDNARDGTLRVDTDDIYAQPIDADPNGMYLQTTPPGDQEASQTESQIYADGSRGHMNDLDDNAIYSVPYTPTRQDVPVTAIDGDTDSSTGDAPALPRRAYGRPLRDPIPEDDVSLTEADRSSMREISYVEPPADYSPERTLPHAAHTNPAFTGDDVTDAHMVTVHQADGYQASFRDRYGMEVPPDPVTSHHSPGTRRNLPAGSVKSLKSLYRYMDTDEPCALDREIEYTFVSSFH